MKPQDLDIILAVIAGTISGIVAASLTWLHLSRKAGLPVLPVPKDDAPFLPGNTESLRLLKICEGCRRYQGEDRVISKGQHLNVMLVICPRCAAHRANVSAANLKPQAA